MGRIERCRFVTWERRSDDPDLLTLTNLWPHREKPAYGPFVRASVDGLEARGLRSDVLFIRGYMGPLAYLYGALIVMLLRVAKRDYPLVHAHGGETALIARLYRGAPVVASYLGSDLLAPQEGGWRLRMKCRVQSAILRRHAVLMTATTTKTHEMEAKLPHRARARNRVIPDGIDLDHFAPRDRRAARARLGWPSDARIVMFAGRAESPGKRLWLAREAVAIAQGELHDLELMVVSGANPDEMPLYYSAADCLLHTSASEGSPNVIKEALACDLPIVATPAGDIEQLVAGARPGVVVPADACTLAREVVACCREPKRSNGRSLTGGMGLADAAEATVDLYRSLASGLGERAIIVPDRCVGNGALVTRDGPDYEIGLNPHPDHERTASTINARGLGAGCWPCVDTADQARRATNA
jgi:glycosyltransferase involved in cell wall biosynthesis